MDGLGSGEIFGILCLFGVHQSCKLHLYSTISLKILKKKR
jgi:hypothetical protein